jgi:DNA polymerase-4
MAVLRETSPLVEPLSLDEAFVDLAAARLPDLGLPTVTALAELLRAQVAEVTGGLTASVGVGSSKFIAKVASDLDKPDGLVVVPPGTEMDLLRPMHVSVIPGVGPATTERLRRAGIHTVADLETVSEDELVRMLGAAHGHSLHLLGHAHDDRPVVPERETKSVSVEGTYDTDLTDRRLMAALLTRQARSVSDRLKASGLAGRTVTIKVRLHDFTTISRSTTLGSPTDTASTIGRLAVGLLQDLDTTGGVRLLGVGVSGLADWIQEDLFGDTVDDEVAGGTDADLDLEAPSTAGARSTTHAWAPGMDVEHATMGRGWVWGSGRGVVTVRFETADTPPGPVRSYPIDDPDLEPWRPEPDSGVTVPDMHERHR